MSSQLLDNLQSKFECLQCGKCCKYGGDMELTAYEVGNIVMNASDLYGPDLASEFVPVHNKPGYFKLVNSFPCVFFNPEFNSCNIYDFRPSSCKRYPFESFACGETTLAGVTICEAASRTVLNEYFADKEP